MKKFLLCIAMMLTTVLVWAQDKDFHIYLAFGQSNMEGNAKIESRDTVEVNPRFRVMNAVDNTKKVG